MPTTAEEAAAAALRPGYRGKCLYKTGKCMNERALKTSGQPHNLCEEHRNRQNQHQRKLDAKNRLNRKEKRAKAERLGLVPAAGAGAGAGTSTQDATRMRYAPYAKARVSPSPTSASAGAAAAGGPGGPIPDEAAGAVPNMLPGNLLPTSLPTHGLPYQSMPLASAPPLLPGAPSVVPEMMANGWVVLPNGPQPPQMPYNAPVQDFDGIVVPIPSTIEGQERAEFRARVYQKVMDFIAEEYGRRSTGSEADKSGSITPVPAVPVSAEAIPPHMEEGADAVMVDASGEASNASSSTTSTSTTTTERRPDEETGKEEAGMDAKTDPTDVASPSASANVNANASANLNDSTDEQVAPKKTRGRPRKAML